MSESSRDRSREKRRIFTEVKGLRMLWAMPAASFPTRAIFSACNRCSRLFSSSPWIWSTSLIKLPTLRLSALISFSAGRLMPSLSAASVNLLTGPRIWLIMTKARKIPRKKAAATAATAINLSLSAWILLSFLACLILSVWIFLYCSQRERILKNWPRTSLWSPAPVLRFPAL